MRSFSEWPSESYGQAPTSVGTRTLTAVDDDGGAGTT